MIGSDRKDIFNFRNYNNYFKLIIAFLVFFISIAYSVLNSALMVTGDLVYRATGDIRIIDVRINGVTNGGVEQYSPKYGRDTIKLGMKLPNLDSTVTYEVTIKNSSSNKYKISAITDKIVGNPNISYINNYTNATVGANSTITVLLTYKYNSSLTTLPNDILKETTISFAYEKFQNTLYEKIKSDYENGGNAELYTGDKSTFLGDKEVYYYKGVTTSNNVIFAGFCWKIFRTTETGGVKMIYNGVPSSGQCNNTGSASTIGSSAFNTSYTSPAYVGYMYNKVYQYDERRLSTNSSYLYGNSFTYSGGTYRLTNTQSIILNETTYTSLTNKHYTCFNTTGTCTTLSYIYAYDVNELYVTYINLTNGKSINDALNEMLYDDNVNTINSSIKTTVDTWYKNNMTRYTGYLEDTIWCNDRSIYNKGGFNPNGGAVMYSSLSFNSTQDTDDLTCQNKNDRFTVSSTNGNGKLTYPVGLVTKQEQALTYYSNNSPMQNSDSYWTLSPNFYSSNWFASNFSVYSMGNLSDSTVYYSNGTRPVVSLRSGIEYSSGDGTSTDPFQIVIPNITNLTVTSTDSWNGVNVKANLNSSSDNVYAQDVTICLKQESGTCEDADYKSPEEATLKLTGVSFNGETVNIKVSVKDSAGNEISKTVPYTLYTECQDVNLVETTLKETGACSKACGGGTRTDIYNTKDKNSGNACLAKTISVLNISCNTQECCSTTSEEYSGWSGWGGCSASCGGGSQTRSRTVYRKSIYDGRICSTSTEYSSQACNTQGCCSSLTYGYSGWSGWGGCSASCGGGSQSRSRTVYRYSAYNGGLCSTGTEYGSQLCNTQSC